MKNFFTTILYIPIYNILIFFAWLSNGSVGWAIILLTVLIRIALLPSSIKAARAQVKNMTMQPKIAALKVKHKNDQKTLNEETMKLYKEEGFSPLGSCLPLLIQLPIIIVLYQVVRNGFDTSSYNLLYSFTPRPELLHTFFLGINLAKPDLWVLPIITGVTQLILSFMTMPPKQPKQPGAPMDPTAMMSKQMLYFLPIMTAFIARSLPAGATIYLLVTTIISIAQQWYVNKEIKGKVAMPPRMAANIGTDGITLQVPEQIEAVKDTAIVAKPSRRDMINDMRRKKLDKLDSKKGVEITIRKKK